MPKPALLAPSCIAAALAAILIFRMGAPAEAACFESGVGCTDDHRIPMKVLNTLSCDALWTVRNAIYDENGYCFKSARAKAVFSNEDCEFTVASRVPLNDYERVNISRIVQAERNMGCE